jgi:hypothetical protein
MEIWKYGIRNMETEMEMKIWKWNGNGNGNGHSKRKCFFSPSSFLFSSFLSKR